MPRMTEATYNADLHDARSMLLDRVNAYKSAYQDQFAKHVEDMLADEWNPHLTVEQWVERVIRRLRFDK
jgi:hypothetical protein